MKYLDSVVYVFNELHDELDNIYEEVMDLEHSKAKKNIEELIKKLRLLKSDLSKDVL
jgi:ABC-type phosphate transport system auxiliary subunit